MPFSSCISCVSSMSWDEVRTTYPDQWLIVEALEALTSPDSKRQLSQIAVIAPCADSRAAIANYRMYHAQFLHREFYFVHTSREYLDIREETRPGFNIRVRL